MKIDDIQLSLVRYKLDKLLISCTGIKDYIVQESNIGNIVLEKDFDNSYFPLFTLSLGVPGWVARAMRKSTGNIKIYVNMTYGFFRNSAIEISEKPAFNKFIAGTFYGIIDDTSATVTEDIQTTVEKDNESFNKGDAYSDLEFIRILLYNETYLNGSRIITNAILSSANLLNALTFVMNKAGLSNVLMSPPSNNRQLSPFCITPISAVDQIDRICNEYGMHSTGTVIFFDLDKIYIVDKQTACTAYVPNEYKIVYLASLLKSGTDTSAASGCYTNSKEKYHFININSRNISSVSNTDLNDKIFGNNFSIVDTKTGAITSASAGSSKIRGTTQILVSNTGGDTTSAIKQSLAEDRKIINIPCKYINLDMLTPNKEFMISLDGATFAKYNGKVRLCGYRCIFSNEGGYFCPNVVATFKG